jgi:hypothetical protein
MHITGALECMVVKGGGVMAVRDGYELAGEDLSVKKPRVS